MIGAPAPTAGRTSRSRWTMPLGVLVLAAALLASGLAAALAPSRAMTPPHAPAIRLPRGFAPAARYTHLAR